MTAPIKSIGLSCRKGTSDKVYRLSLDIKDDGFAVNYEYGRRGSPLRKGTKTPAAVERSVAEECFNAAVAEKLAKGHLPDDGEPKIDLLTQTKPGRNFVADFAGALQEELWSRKYGHSWGLKEEFAKVLEEHPELLALEVCEAAGALLANLPSWSPRLAEKEAVARSRWTA